MKRLVFEKQKHVFLLESLLLEIFRNPVVFRHLSGDAGGMIVLIAGEDPEFQTSDPDISGRPGPPS